MSSRSFFIQCLTIRGCQVTEAHSAILTKSVPRNLKQPFIQQPQHPVQLNNLSARAFTCGFNKTSNPDICHSRDSRKIQTQHDPLTTLCTQSQHWLFCSSSAQGYNQQAIFSTQYCRDVTSRCQGYLYCIHVFLTSVDKKSFGNSDVASACVVKSPESEKGVSGLIFNMSPFCDLWPQELIQTSASTASMSFCSRVLQVDLSLSWRCLSRIDS